MKGSASDRRCGCFPGVIGFPTPRGAAPCRRAHLLDGVVIFDILGHIGRPEALLCGRQGTHQLIRRAGGKARRLRSRSAGRNRASGVAYHATMEIAAIGQRASNRAASQRADVDGVDVGIKLPASCSADTAVGTIAAHFLRRIKGKGVTSPHACEEVFITICPGAILLPQHAQQWCASAVEFKTVISTARATARRTRSSIFSGS